MKPSLQTKPEISERIVASVHRSHSAAATWMKLTATSSTGRLIWHWTSSITRWSPSNSHRSQPTTWVSRDALRWPIRVVCFRLTQSCLRSAASPGSSLAFLPFRLARSSSLSVGFCSVPSPDEEGPNTSHSSILSDRALLMNTKYPLNQHATVWFPMWLLCWTVLFSNLYAMLCVLYCVELHE